MLAFGQKKGLNRKKLLVRVFVAMLFVLGCFFFARISPLFPAG